MNPHLCEVSRWVTRKLRYGFAKDGLTSINGIYRMVHIMNHPEWHEIGATISDLYAIQDLAARPRFAILEHEGSPGEPKGASRLGLA